MRGRASKRYQLTHFFGNQQPIEVLLQDANCDSPILSKLHEVNQPDGLMIGLLLQEFNTTVCGLEPRTNLGYAKNGLS